MLLFTSVVVSLFAMFSGVNPRASCFHVQDDICAAVTNLFVVLVSSMSSASKTTAHVCPFTDITSPEVCSCCQSAKVEGFVSFSFINVLLISVLIHTSPVCAVNANIAASEDTTKVSPIARGGSTELSSFPDAFNAATQFATFFSD